MGQATAGSTTWVGRTEELARVAAAVEGGGSVVVRGEPGVGKSALVHRAVASAGRRAVVVRCFRSLTRAPAAALHLAFGEPIPVGDPLWTAQWVARRLDGRVLVVDDLQWADDLTRAVVVALVGLERVVATVRVGDAADTVPALEAAEILDLAPLDADDGTDLARRLHAHLQPEEAQALAARCDGNPLLIEELGRGEEAAGGLRSAVVTRLRRCGADARLGFVRLVRAGEPLPQAWVPGLDRLLEARLVVLDDGQDGQDGQVRVRHALLAHVVAEHLSESVSDDDVAEVDDELATLALEARRPGLAARLLAASGRRTAACAAARDAAAVTPHAGERAEMLRLAATNAEPDEAPALAEAAVRELVQAGAYAEAADLIDSLPPREDAAWLTLVGRVRWQAGDDAGTLEAFAAAMAALPLVEDGRLLDPVQVVLRSEYARSLGITGSDLQTAERLAGEAVELAETAGVERARAWGARGTVGFYAGRADALGQMRRAIEVADSEETEPGVVFTVTNNLVSMLESAGETDEAVALGRRAAARADGLRMRSWAHQLTAGALNAEMHQGRYGAVLAEGLALLDGVTERRTADQLEITVGIALVDLGRLDEARARMRRAYDSCADDAYGRASLDWLAAEERIWSGQPTEAVALADRSVADTVGLLRWFSILTAAMARAQAGLPVPEVDADPAEAEAFATTAAAPHELNGLLARSTGDPSARPHFLEAAARWRGRHRRGELRCRWLAADSAPAEGSEHQAAVAELSALEAELAELGWLPLLGVVRRSLRERGVRRVAPRGRSGDLTLREKEVLDLVARGLSTDAIAVRLGLSPATVAAQVASGRARRGARSRWQAAGGG